MKKPFTKAALARSAPLFAWLGEDASQLDGLLARRSPPAVEELWKELVTAHALDLFHDEGMQGLAWPTTASQALAALALLLKIVPTQPEQTLELNGFRLIFCPAASPVNDSAVPSVTDQDPMETLRVLTMEDVQRDLAAWPAGDTFEVSRLLRQKAVLPLPALGLASGAFLALAVLGRLTRTPALVEEREVRSALLWEDWRQGEGPTGEFLEIPR